MEFTAHILLGYDFLILFFFLPQLQCYITKAKFTEEIKCFVRRCCTLKVLFNFGGHLEQSRSEVK